MVVDAVMMVGAVGSASPGSIEATGEKQAVCKMLENLANLARVVGCKILEGNGCRLVRSDRIRFDVGERQSI